MSTDQRSYADVTGTNPLDTGCKPIFFRHRDAVPDYTQKLTSEEVYLSIATIIDPNNIVGIQRIGGLWRIYLEDRADRIILITHGLSLKGKSIPVHDKNPFRRTLTENLLAVIIRDVPLSVDDGLIRQTLESLKCRLNGAITRRKLRINGRLTNCENGERTAFIELPSRHLPRDIMLGSFRARLFHPGQAEGVTPKCSRCLAQGHHRSTCTSDVRCLSCGIFGHMKRDCQQSFNSTYQPSPVRPVNNRPYPPSQAGHVNNGIYQPRQSRTLINGTPQTARPVNNEIYQPPPASQSISNNGLQHHPSL